MKQCARACLGAWLLLLALSLSCRASEFDVSGPWGVALSDGKVRFSLGDENLGADIVVWHKIGGRPRSYQLLRWEKSRDEILMWISAPGRQNEGVDWRDHSFVGRSFPAVRGENGEYVIDVTSLFTGEGAWALSFNDRTGAYPAHPGIEVHDVSAYPRNVVVRAVQSPQEGQLGNAWNFVVLPGNPMDARLFDPRVGYQYPGHSFFSGEPAAESNEVILRWRLEQSSLGEGVSEPKTPIVIHIDPNTPEKWKKWVRRGVHAWEGPFESAGFVSALEVVDGSDVLDWSYDDLRRSVMCWGYDRNSGCGSWDTIFDPRTGEMLQFQIPVNQAFKSLLARYVVTMSSLDSRVIGGALEDVAGTLLQYVVSHEAGHLFGLRDGTYGTGVYTEQNVRSAAWVRVHGFSPSVMNYSRFNYVAQPEDEMPFDLLVQGVGPADHYSIRLGYATSFSGERGHGRSIFPKSQLQLLDRNPAFRYGRGAYEGSDPGNVNDVVSISDPIRASALGVKNLERSVELLANHDLRIQDMNIQSLLGRKQLYEAAVAQWIDMSKHSLSLIGSYVPKQGLNVNMRVSDLKQLQDAGSVSPVEEGLQHDAMDHLCRNVFTYGPEFLIQSDFSRESGFSDSEVRKKIRDGKEYIFGLLARPERWRRLVDQGEKMHRALPGSLTSPKEWAVVNVIRGLKSCLVDQVETADAIPNQDL